MKEFTIRGESLRTHKRKEASLVQWSTQLILTLKDGEDWPLSHTWRPRQPS